MGILPVLISTITSIVVYSLLFAGVYKLYSIATDLTEIKELLKEQKRDRDAQALIRNETRPAPDRFASLSPR